MSATPNMRYLPLTDQDRSAMLAEIGVNSVDDLYKDVPASAYKPGGADLPAHQGEMAVERQLTRMAQKNQTAGSGPFFLGCGNYRHHVPATVDALIQRGEFLTAYTPYQPEVSQGTLQYLFEFQTQVAQITGMDVANASMYDGATACAEAAMMATRVTRRKKVLLSGTVHPHYAQTTETYLRYTDIEAEILPPDPIGMEDLLSRVASDLACVIVQSPSFFGNLKDYEVLGSLCKESGVLLVVVVAEPVSLGLIRSPGEMGADIVVGEGQGLGNAMAFGGPGLGLFATTDKYVRQMPGRLVGETEDVDGRRGWVLTLATREQHIRREKATSNICTNSGLCALAFSIHMGLLGDAGFTKLAEINHAKAALLADKIEGLKGQGVDLLTKTFFNEISVNLPRPAAEVVEELAARGILAGVPASRFWPSYEELDTVLLLAANELTDEADMDDLVAALKEVL